MQVAICYTNIVANGSSCCFFIRIQGCICRNMEGHAVSFDTVSRDAQTPNLSRNVSKFYAGQVVSLVNEQPNQFVAQSRPALYYSQQRVDCES